MQPMPDSDRELGFAALIAELHALVGRRVVIEAGAVEHPLALAARGRLRYLADAQLTLGAPLGRPAMIAFWLEGSEVLLTLREDQLIGARAYTVPGGEGPPSCRHVQICLAGGAELVIAPDPLVAFLEFG